MSQFEFMIAVDHASLAGHFPGNPVVPGVVILDAVRQGLAGYDSSLRLEVISSVKFIRPVKPGMPVSVTITQKKTGLLDFNCESEDNLMVKGTLRVSQANETAVD